MGKFQAPGRVSGRTYNFKISGDTPNAAERDRISQYVQDQEGIFSQQFEKSVGTAPVAPSSGYALTRGLESGWDAANSQLASAAEYLGKATGIGALTSYGQNERNYYDTQGMLTSLANPTPLEWNQVRGIGSLGTYLGEQIGQTLPQTLSAMGAAALAPETAGASLLAMGAASTPFMFGSNVQRQEAEVAAGRKASVNPGEALVAAVGQGTLEAIADKLVLTGLFKPGANMFTRVAGNVANATVKGPVKKALVRTATGALEGATTEGLTEVAQQILERKQAGLPLADDQAIKEYVSAGIAGGAVGGVISGGMSSVGLGHGDHAPKPKPTPSTTPGTKTATPNASAGSAPDASAGAASVVTPTQEGKVPGWKGNVGSWAEPTPAGGASTVAPTPAAPTPAPNTSGWKLHLNPTPGAEQAISDYLKSKGIPHKVGHSSGQVGKGITVYVGARDAANAVATDLDTRFASSLGEATGDVLTDDTQLAGKVWGRFDIGKHDAEFHQYGTNGVPFLNEDMSQLLYADDRKAAADQAQQRAHAELTKRYGNFYTGSAASVAPTTGAASVAPTSVAPTVAPAPKTPLDNAKELIANENPSEVGMSYLKRKLGVGHVDAMNILTQLENEGVLSAPNKDTGRRSVLTPQDDLQVTEPFEDATPPMAATSSVDPRNVTAAQQVIESTGITTKDVLEDKLGIDSKTANELLAALEASGVITAPDSLGKRRLVSEIERVSAAADAHEAKRSADAAAYEAKRAADADAEFMAMFTAAEAHRPKQGEPHAVPDEAGTPGVGASTISSESGTAQGDTTGENLGAGTAEGLNPGGVGTDTANVAGVGTGESAQPGALTPADLHKVSGLITPVDPKTLEPIGEPRFAPVRFTGSPTKVWQRWLAQRAQAVAVKNDPIAGATAAAGIKEWFDTHAPNAIKKFRAYIDGAAHGAEDNTLHTDKEAVLALLKTRNAPSKAGKNQKESAFQFFSHFPNITEALQEIGALSAIGSTSQGVRGDTELAHKTSLGVEEDRNGAVKFYKGLNRYSAKAAAEWVTTSLSPAAQFTMTKARQDTVTATKEAMKASAGISTADAMVQRANAIATKEEDSERRAMERAAKAQAAVREISLATGEPVGKQHTIHDNRQFQPRIGETIKEAIRRELTARGEITAGMDKATANALVDDYHEGYKEVWKLLDGRLHLPEFAVDSMALPLPPSVQAAARAGNLSATLEAIAATHQNPSIANIALRLSKVSGNTSIEVVDNLVDARGNQVAGLFDPATNKVKLHSTLGMNAHTVVHEMAHAALSHTLANSSHATTAAVQSVYDSVKEVLGTVYGSTSLQEFAAEALSNPEFRGTLSRLTAEGDKVSAWTRFSNAMLNFLRRVIGLPTKQVNTALTAVDDALLASLAPAPKFRGAGSLYMASSAEGAAERMAIMSRTEATLKAATPDTMGKVADAFSNYADSAQGIGTQAWLSVQNFPMLAEVARKKGLSAGEDVLRTIEEMQGATSEHIARIAGNSKQFEEVRYNADEAQYDAFMDMSNLGNSAGVDFRKARMEYTDKDHLDVWDRGNAVYKGLPPKLRHLYSTLLDYYKKERDDSRNAVIGIVDNLTDDFGKPVPQPIILGLKNSFLVRIIESAGNIDGYMPMVRKGDYWLKFSARATPTSSPEVVFKTFATAAERSRAMAALSDMEGIVKDANGKPEFDTSVRLDPRLYKNAPDGSFIRNVLTLLDQAHVADKVKQQFMTMVIETMPETSFAKSMQQREGYPGFEKDPVEAFNTHAPNVARQIERLKYSRVISDQNRTMMETWNTTRDPGTKALTEELMLRSKFALNPPPDPWADKITRATFIYSLSANVSSAVVQTASVPMIVLPNLVARYGSTRTVMSAISTATKLFSGSGLSRNQATEVAFEGESSVKVRSAPSLDNYFVADGTGYKVRTDQNFTPERVAYLTKLIPLVKEMAAQNMLSRSIFFDSFGVEDAGRARSLWARANAYAGSMFSVAERMNRQVTAAATYELEVAKLTKANLTMSEDEVRQQAAQRAVRLTTKLHGGHSLSMTPRLLQRGWGRVLGMFRAYGLHMTNMQIEYMIEAVGHRVRDFQKKLDSGLLPKNQENLALLEELKEDQRVAQRATLGMWGASFLLAGAAGTPLFNAIAMMVNATLLGSDEDDFETIVRKHIGEGWYKGWLTELSGMDVSSRIGLSGLLLRADRFNSNPSPADTFMNTFGGPAWATGARIYRGTKEISSGGDMWRGIEQLLPAGIANGMKAMRYATEGMTTRRGDPVVSDVSLADIAGQFFGFAPTDYTMNQERNQVAKRQDTAITTERTKLLRAMYLSMRTNNVAGAQRAASAIHAFNQKHPSNRIEPKDMHQSMKEHIKTTRDMFNGITISSANRPEILQSARDWDHGWNMF